MTLDTLKKALSINKYVIVKRTLRLKGYTVNDTECADLDDDASLDDIEAKLKPEASEPSDRFDGWFKRLFKS
ncbi:MAG: hypothetical protein ACU83N_11115 [Gammaproteobacteria bacterium]